MGWKGIWIFRYVFGSWENVYINGYVDEFRFKNSFWKSVGLVLGFILLDIFCIFFYLLFVRLNFICNGC